MPQCTLNRLALAVLSGSTERGRKSQLTTTTMTEFVSWRSYRLFAASVEEGWRYIRNSEQAEFLDALLATSTDRTEVLSVDHPLWRAQVGSDQVRRDEGTDVQLEEVPFPVERMKSRLLRAIEGRANPKGIPYLYVATDEETAIAEVRPWVGAQVSVALLRTGRELRIVNCARQAQSEITLYFGSEPPAYEREDAVWIDIDRAFSEPVTRDEDVATYAPTQIIAEWFRRNGFDGVKYRSALGQGQNIAVFDPGVARVVKCWLVKTKRLKLQLGNPYSITDYE